MTTRKFLMTAAMVLPFALSAQEQWITRTGTVSFFASTAMENIEAKNNSVSSVFDATTGEVVFSALIKSFEFKKALMQEHFNENYMESTKFPKASFKGKVDGIKPGDLRKPGTYEVTVSGEMTMHGVTKPVSTKGSFVVAPTGSVKASCDFIVIPEDYGIKIP
ncbi:MAG: YceI family protein, partial [Flavobacteriales bacterium]